jgi:hypothetical protein
MQREALLKGDEGKRQEALAMVQSLQQQIAAIENLYPDLTKLRFNLDIF